MNPRFHEGRLCRATARTSTPMRPSGAGRERRPLAICAWGAGRRCRACPGVGRGEGRQIPGRAVQPERRGETALPDGPAIKGRNTPAPIPSTRQMHIPPWLWFRLMIISSFTGRSCLRKVSGAAFPRENVSTGVSARSCGSWPSSPASCSSSPAVSARFPRQDVPQGTLYAPAQNRQNRPPAGFRVPGLAVRVGL